MLVHVPADVVCESEEREQFVDNRVRAHAGTEGGDEHIRRTGYDEVCWTGSTNSFGTEQCCSQLE